MRVLNFDVCFKKMMRKKIETKLEIACRQIPGYLDATQILEQYILINDFLKLHLSLIVVSWLI